MATFERVRVDYHCPYCDTNLSGGNQVICPACTNGVKYPTNIQWGKDIPEKCPNCFSTDIMVWINHDRATCHECNHKWDY